MTRSTANPWRGSRAERPDAPRPVPVRRYRYSKLRWRVAVHVIDAIGNAAMRLWRMARPLPAPKTPRKILVVQLDHLGDAVLTSPLVARLRSAYPHARIDLLASPSNHEVFEADPHVDHVWLAARNWFDRQGRRAMLSAVWSLGRSLRGTGYDLGIDVRGDILSVLVLALAGIPRRVGWSMGGGGFLLTDVAEWRPGRHEVRSRLALLDQMGVPDDANEPARVSVHVTDFDRVEVASRLREAWSQPGDREESTRLAAIRSRSEASRLTWVEAPESAPEPEALREDGGDWLHADRFGSAAPLLAVHLGAGTFAKRWPDTHWRVLIGRFLTEGWRVVMVGGADDAKIARGVPAHPWLRDWTGAMTVTQTAALLERADLFIGSDSGPSHLAASAGTPSVVLFSGTNRASQWRPWSRRSLILKQPVPCRPCHHKVCPLADHPCMTGLEPERVYRSAKRWWARLHREESPHAPF